MIVLQPQRQPAEDEHEAPEMSGIIAMRPNMKREAMSETIVATMKTPVPQKMPARALTMKNTTSGPTSTASLMICDFFADAVSCGLSGCFVGHVRFAP